MNNFKFLKIEHLIVAFIFIDVSLFIFWLTLCQENSNLESKNVAAIADILQMENKLAALNENHQALEAKALPKEVSSSKFIDNINLKKIGGIVLFIISIYFG